MQQIEPIKINSVLYITTQIPGTLRYFSWGAYPNIWYARLQAKVIKVLKASNKKNVFIKFYPKDLCNNPNIEICRKDKAINILTGSLPKILEDSRFDLIISEAWATTFLEVLCTKSQVIMFYPKDFMRIEPQAMKIITDRVFVADNEDSYLSLIGDALAEISPLATKNLNDEFLFTYGIESPASSHPIEKAQYHLEKIIHDFT